ncbi:hypothetical protein CLV93_10321 [Prolixibacter denitrificans]|uniref:Uncharacterized protein n=1 Tax=Prolixibacter denitrificans TaxID=1541063 RepID=A0A2P8CF87_9BACT|nr:hypothetical protein CLV93_10321 [Prolixibacter denitrificans]
METVFQVSSFRLCCKLAVVRQAEGLKAHSPGQGGTTPPRERMPRIGRRRTFETGLERKRSCAAHAGVEQNVP